MTREWVLNAPLAEGQAAVYYLGQEGILLQAGGRTLAVDPYLTDYVDVHCCTEAVRWKRRYPAPVTPEELAFVDFVLLTHEHFDHADPDTISRIAAANPRTVFVAPAPIREAVLSYGVREEQLADALADEAVALGPFSVTPVPAAHEVFHTDAQGRFREVGYRIAFCGMSVFHAGDCCIYDGLEARIANADVLFLPINGRSVFKNREDIIGNMTAEEAVELALRANAGMLVPLHFDLYDVNGVNPAVFVDLVTSAAPALRYHIFRPGERYVLCP